MIELTKGNILRADAEALVNAVNCVGFMGKGIALQFKKAYPENFEAYRKACAAREVRLGRMFIFDLQSMLNPKYVINFPTSTWLGIGSQLKAGFWKYDQRLGRYCSLATFDNRTFG